MRSPRFLIAGIAASVVIGGGIGMTVLQLRAGDANEPGSPNIDTRSWVTERGAEGYLVRRPRNWFVRPFDNLVGNRLRSAGVTVANKPHDFGRFGSEVVGFDQLPAGLAAVRVVHSSGGPVQLPTDDPDTSYPLALEQAAVDRARSTGGVMARTGLTVGGRAGWAIEAWVGDEVGRSDAEIVRRIFSSFAFEDAVVTGALTLEERMIAHEIAESYKGARTALKGRPHTHPDFATDQTGSAKCGGHKCALVVFQITGGLRFRVLVDLVDYLAIAFS